MVGGVGGLICSRTLVSRYYIDQNSNIQMGVAIDVDDFSEEIQDIGNVKANTYGIDDQIFSIQTSKG
jgi:hypothetical protein